MLCILDNVSKQGNNQIKLTERFSIHVHCDPVTISQGFQTIQDLNII